MVDDAQVIFDGPPAEAIAFYRELSARGSNNIGGEDRQAQPGTTPQGEIGPSTQAFVTQLLQRFRHPEHGYRSCLGLLGLAKRYGPARLEAACARTMRHPDVVTGLNRVAQPILYRNRADFAAFSASESEKFRTLITAAGLRSAE